MSKLVKSASASNFHSIKTIANRLDLSPRTVQRLIDSRQLQAVKIGGSWRISELEFQRLLDNSRVV